MKTSTGIETVTTPHLALVAVCRKCLKKLDGGFGDDRADQLDRALRLELRRNGRRGELRIVRAGCFGICPKRAVTLAHSGEPGELLLVPVGTSAAEVLARLIPSERSRTPAPGP